jgi:transcriptional regulator with XRE-family HTH domain
MCNAARSVDAFAFQVYMAQKPECETSMVAQLKSGAMPRYIDDLNELGGLSGTDIANIADVSKATVSRWKAGTVRPQPDTQLILSDLRFVVQRLSEYYTAAEIRTWLYARHPQLEGQRAIDLINQNRSEEILRILDRLDSDVYL